MDRYDIKIYRGGNKLVKKLASLLCLVVALSLCATAQTLITFSDMPSVNVPVPVPEGYPAGSYLTWNNFYYVSPLLWSGTGPGFSSGPNLRQAFMGGPLCTQAINCTASISIPITPNSTASFQPVSANLSAGWAANSVLVVAYNQSNFLGSVTLALTTTSQEFNFPTNWTNVTQLRFFPTPAQGQPGSMVLYTLTVNLNN
jgi:hypothetical protein